MWGPPSLRKACAALAALALAGCAGDAKVRKTRDGVSVRLDGATLAVRVCSENILRLTLTPDGAPEVRKSLSVRGDWKGSRWMLERDSASVSVKTRRMSARVSLDDGSVRFADDEGNPLLSAAAPDSGSWTPATVQGEDTRHARQVFRLSRDEALYGLGQFQDGIVNWRGHDALLVQANRIAVNPFLVSTAGWGLLWDNPSETRFHDGPDGMSFRSEVADAVDYYVVRGADPDAVVAGYREATGRAPLFPKWAYGYFQSKERYRTAAELLAVAREFRERLIPLDCLVQDWQYWGGDEKWSGMVWDPERFPDPAAAIDTLHRDLHVRLMNSIWPAVGPDTDLYRELEAEGLVFGKRHWSGGKLYDAYSDRARGLYWKHLNRGLFSIGVDAFWMDATEPELTSSGDPYVTGAEIRACGSNALGTFSRFLNPYSLATTRGVYENWRRTTRDKRPFILTRSAFAGQQKYAAATWSGDIGSSWDVLRLQVAAGINFCLSGIPYWTTDIGGFLPDAQGGMYPDGLADPAFRELFVRWFQFGAFSPVFRAHGTGAPREPWRFGDPGSANYEALLRYDRLRYRLLPYVYSTAWRVTHAGYTMMRGLAMDFSKDPAALGVADQYLFGPALLACPVTEGWYFPTRKREDFIPAGRLFGPDEGRGALRAEFFAGQDFDRRVRDLPMVETALTWSGSVPESLQSSDYCVRWTGEVEPPAPGPYRFVVRTDGGVRLWADGRKVLDRWDNTGVKRFEAGASWNGAGRLALRIEHRQPGPGTANFKFEWIPPVRATRSAVPGRPVYLPAGVVWTDFWTGRTLEGGQTVFREAPLDIMPLYLRSGSILPMGPHLQYADEKPADPIELRVVTGADAVFTLYEDEGDNQNYENNAYATIPLRWDEAGRTLVIGRRKGGFAGMLRERTFRVVWVREGRGVGADETPDPDAVVRYTGGEVRVIRN